MKTNQEQCIAEIEEAFKNVSWSVSDSGTRWACATATAPTIEGDENLVLDTMSKVYGIPRTSISYIHFRNAGVHKLAVWGRNNIPMLRAAGNSLRLG